MLLAVALAALSACRSDAVESAPIESVFDAAQATNAIDARAEHGVQEAALRVADPRPRRSARSDGGRFDVEWSADPGIVFNEPFELDCSVRLVSGEPADGVQVTASAWMPAHRHGMVRQARTEALGDGRYRVRGMLLHMDGHWQLFIDLGLDGTFERASFDLLLAPDEVADAVAEFTADEVSRLLALSPLSAPPDDPTNAYDLDAAAAHLGQYLFFEPRLSGSGATSCATCHQPERAWSDGKALASAEGQLTRRTMSLWNVAHQRWFFWDGRADSLWSQALGPLEDAREMAGDRTSIAKLVASDPQLSRAYARVFGAAPDAATLAALAGPAKPLADEPEAPVAKSWAALSAEQQAAVNTVFANVGKALAAFQRRIESRDSPFDQFVAGLREGDALEIESLTPAARRGLKLFLGRANCHLCHSGPLFSDKEFHNNRAPMRSDLSRDLGRMTGVLRLMSDEFNGVGAYSDAREGETRSKLEHLPVSGHVWGEFRTPSLRSVALGGPYMHQGQFETLADVIDFYSDEIPPPSPHGDGEIVLRKLGLEAQEKLDLIEFLHALTGAPLPESLLRQPSSPLLE